MITLSEERKESRRANDELWDKKFTDNEDLDSDGHLSRTEHRKQRSHNSMITTILIVLIIVLAATPLIYWINNKQSFNHPVRTEQVATSSENSKKNSKIRYITHSPYKKRPLRHTETHNSIFRQKKTPVFTLFFLRFYLFFFGKKL